MFILLLDPVFAFLKNTTILSQNIYIHFRENDFIIKLKEEDYIEE